MREDAPKILATASEGELAGELFSALWRRHVVRTTRPRITLGPEYLVLFDAAHICIDRTCAFCARRAFQCQDEWIAPKGTDLDEAIALSGHLKGSAPRLLCMFFDTITPPSIYSLLRLYLPME